MAKLTKNYSNIPNISLKTLLFLLNGKASIFKIYYMNILLLYVYEIT